MPTESYKRAYQWVRAIVRQWPYFVLSIASLILLSWYRRQAVAEIHQSPTENVQLENPIVELGIIEQGTMVSGEVVVSKPRGMPLKVLTLVASCDCTVFESGQKPQDLIDLQTVRFPFTWHARLPTENIATPFEFILTSATNTIRLAGVIKATVVAAFNAKPQVIELGKVLPGGTHHRTLTIESSTKTRQGVSLVESGTASGASHGLRITTTELPSRAEGRQVFNVEIRIPDNVETSVLVSEEIKFSTTHPVLTNFGVKVVGTIQPMGEVEPGEIFISAGTESNDVILTTRTFAEGASVDVFAVYPSGSTTTNALVQAFHSTSTSTVTTLMSGTLRGAKELRVIFKPKSGSVMEKPFVKTIPIVSI